MWVRVTGFSSSVSSSSAALTVTVWAVFQLVVVNVRALLVRAVPDSDTSVPACPLTVTVTSALGWVPRTTV